MTASQDLLVHADGDQFVVLEEPARSRMHSQPDAAAAIQHALDAVNGAGGGSVQLESGTYLLDRPLRVPSRTALAGRGHATVIGASRAFAGEAAVIVEESRAASVGRLTISGLIDGPLANGLVVRRSPHSLVDTVSVGGSQGAGFIVDDNSVLTQVRGCIAAGNARCGYLLKDNYRGPYGDFAPLSVQNCLVFGGGTGFELDRCIVANITGCSVY